MTALTPANQLTILRMLLIPVLALLVIYERLGWALAVFMIAALTDALDGLLARRAGQKTTLGAWLDPVADKLLLLTMFVVLTLPLPHLVQRIPLWLTVLVFSRDIGIVVTVAIVNLAVGPRTFPPSIFGQGGDRDVPADGRGDAVGERDRAAPGAGGSLRVAVAGAHRGLSAPLRRVRDAPRQHGIGVRDKSPAVGRRVALSAPRQPGLRRRASGGSSRSSSRAPRSSGTFGSQPSSVRARVMSGWRTFGSSAGSGL